MTSRSEEAYRQGAEYQRDLALMHRAQSDKSQVCDLCSDEFRVGCIHYCRRCGGSGFFLCGDLWNCPQGGGKCGKAHRCRCVSSGGFIVDKIRAMKNMEVPA